MIERKVDNGNQQPGLNLNPHAPAMEPRLAPLPVMKLTFLSCSVLMKCWSAPELPQVVSVEFVMLKVCRSSFGRLHSLACIDGAGVSLTGLESLMIQMLLKLGQRGIWGYEFISSAGTK